MKHSPEYAQTELYNQLQAIDRAMEAGQWTAIAGLLQKTHEIARGDKILLRQVDQKKQIVKQQQQAQIGQWLHEVETGLTNPEAESFDASHLGALLDKTLSLAPDSDKAARLRERLAEVAWQQQERRIHQETLQRCETLWGREQEMVANNVAANEILETCYRAAVRLAEQAAADYPESVLLRGLVRRATIAYNQARDRYEARTTGEETGDWRSLIQELEREKDRNKLIPWRDVKGQEQPPITVAEALREAEKLAVNFAEQKATEYLQEARQHMEAHAPRAAKAELLKSRDLFMLDQETQAQITNYLRDTVEPAIQNLKEAERLLKRAATVPDPEEGWHLLEQAIDAFPNLPGLQDVRLIVAARMISKAEGMINALHVDLKFNHEKEINQKFYQVSKLAEIVVSFPQNGEIKELKVQGYHLQEQISQLTNAFENYKSVSQRIYALLGRGRQFLDSEEYEAATRDFCEAKKLLSEVPDSYISSEDKVAIIYFCDDTRQKHETIISAIHLLTQAENAIQQGDVCTAFDILLCIPKFNFAGKKAISLRTRIEELRETVLKSCAKKLTSIGNFREAEIKLTLSSNPQEAIAEVISQREREIRINRWDESLASNSKEVNIWLMCSFLATLLSLVVLLVGLGFLFTGQISIGIFTTTGSIVPSFITKIVLDIYKDLRAERQNLLQKPTHEIDLETKAWRKVLETSEE